MGKVTAIRRVWVVSWGTQRAFIEGATEHAVRNEWARRRKTRLERLNRYPDHGIPLNVREATEGECEMYEREKLARADAREDRVARQEEQLA